MTLSANSQLLVDSLEALPLLDGRYSGLTLVNNPGGVKRGYFSLVFKAFDELGKRAVAIKFFDIDPFKKNAYRMLCFQREHKILEALKGAKRCLQVESDFSVFQLEVNVSGGGSIVIPAHYFVTEWIQDDVDQYFVEQEKFDALAKLKIFNEVVLAVESIHARGIFHRDLKADNFRARGESRGNEVVVIDLGTAAQLDSGPMLAEYGCPIGFLLYSAPEAFCGLAGERSVAPLSDKFALGCMLFELFHPDDFPTAFRAVNPDYDVRFAALQSRIDAATMEGKLQQWRAEAPRALVGLSPVDLEDHGSSAPPAISEMLSELLAQLTEPNFLNRKVPLSQVRRVIWGGIRVLENELFQKRRAAMAAKRRAARAAKAAAKASRAEVRALAASSGG